MAAVVNYRRGIWSPGFGDQRPTTFELIRRSSSIAKTNWQCTRRNRDKLGSLLMLESTNELISVNVLENLVESTTLYQGFVK